MALILIEPFLDLLLPIECLKTELFFHFHLRACIVPQDTEPLQNLRISLDTQKPVVKGLEKTSIARVCSNCSPIQLFLQWFLTYKTKDQCFRKTFSHILTMRFHQLLALSTYRGNRGACRVKVSSEMTSCLIFVYLGFDFNRFIRVA